VARLALLAPLRGRDFALLWTGMAISLVGDGIFFIAIAWQVYDLTDRPTALSLVSLAWSLGMVGCLLLGGVAADRFDRRRVMIAADAVRGVAIGAMGLLAVTGGVQVWHLAVLSLLYGGAEAFFTPAFNALIPQIVAGPELVQANSLQEVARPIAYRLAGPAVGGALVAAFGAGTAFLVDAATFAVGIACVAAIRARPFATPPAREPLRRQLAEGLAFVRTRAWLWATLLMAGVSVMAFSGPVEVLLPYVIRNDLGAGSAAFGLVLALAGAGSVAAGLVMGQLGVPRRATRLLYVAWGVGLLPVTGYALAGSVWQLGVLAFAYGVGMSTGMVVWATLMQTRVPERLLGRVTSLDWMVSFGLLPVSFAVTGPLASLVGADAVLAGAGLLGAGATLGTYALLPALRADRFSAQQRGDVAGEAGVAHVGRLHPDDLDALARR
jgi:DHA3 family tetracycline resistance protein-like MFS transporter